MSWSSSSGFRLAPLIARAHAEIIARESSSPWEQLVALGALLVAEEAPEVTRFDALRDSLSRRLFEEKLSGWLEALDQTLPDLAVRFGKNGEELSKAERVLELRHELELALRASRRLGLSEPLSSESLGELYAADDELRSAIPSLTALNRWRQKRLSELSPALRQQFFWFESGHSVPADAFAHLEAVQLLVENFPELGNQDPSPESLESLLENQRAKYPDVASPREALVQDPPTVQPRAQKQPQARKWTWAAAATFLFAPLFGYAFVLQANADKAEHEKRSLQEQLEEAQHTAEREVARLRSNLADAGVMSEAQVAALRAQLEAAEKKASGAASAAGTPRPGGAKKSAAKGCEKKGAHCACAPGDPMCGGL